MPAKAAQRDPEIAAAAIERLAAARAQLLEDPAGARELGRKGRERARDEFSWDSIVARVEQLYLSLL